MNLIKTLIKKISSWFEEPEIMEAERFEDWYARLNPKREVDMDAFNKFHINLRKNLNNDISQNNKNPRN